MDVSSRRYATFYDTYYKISLRQLLATLGLNTNGSFNGYVLYSVIENKLDSTFEDLRGEVFPEPRGVNVAQ